MVRALDSRWAGRGFDSRPLHCRATTLGKLFTPMCLCSPSSKPLNPPLIRHIIAAYLINPNTGAWRPENLAGRGLFFISMSKRRILVALKLWFKNWSQMTVIPRKTRTRTRRRIKINIPVGLTIWNYSSWYTKSRRSAKCHAIENRIMSPYIQYCQD